MTVADLAPRSLFSALLERLRSPAEERDADQFAGPGFAALEPDLGLELARH